MSLAGSLEDLGLGEILQILGLSGKSGVLCIRSQADEGRIVFEKGRVRGAWARGGPADLESLLRARSVLPERAIQELVAEARGRNTRLDLVLLERGAVDADALDSLRRASVEAAVRRMFAWSSGEFTFELGEPEAVQPDLLLTVGLSAQFFALECTRLRDEEEAGSAGEIAVDEAGPPGSEPVRVEPAPSAWTHGSESVGPSAPEEQAGAKRSSGRPPVIVIDAELPALEWIKTALAEAFPRVHIFQRSEFGIERVRQYLARAELPLVILAEDAPPDPVSGAAGGAGIAARLRAQAPRMPLVLLREATRTSGADGPEPPGPFPVVEKPGALLLADRRAASRREQLAEALREALAELASSPPSADPI